MPRLLEFEGELEAIETDIAALRDAEDADGKEVIQQLRRLKKTHANLCKKIYATIDDWQICQVARHPARPQAKEYIARLCEDFVELHGDRCYADDSAIIAGIASFNNRPVAVIGQQKGHSTDERIKRNFGMASPEGYRKALRVMNLAEKFHMPLLNFVDTPGAYPGIGAEERGQSSSIGMCLQRAATLRAPILVTVIGEGGSGGALAIAVGDYVSMMRYSIYSVISPEGCASILWKDAQRMADAAKILGLTAKHLKKLGVVDEVIEEPLGGAHREPIQAVELVGKSLKIALEKLETIEIDAVMDNRYRRWRNYGKYVETRK